MLALDAPSPPVVAAACGSSAPRVRRARRHEIDEIVDLVGRAHAETYAPPTLDIQQYLADTAAKAHRHRRFWRTYLVAEQAGRIVGVVQTFENVVNALYVDKDARRCGIGARLLAAAEATMRAKGVGSARVRVADGYPRVMAFYERQGWRIAGKGEALASDPRWGLQLLEMRKQLGRRDDRRFAVLQRIQKSGLIAVATVLIILSSVLMHTHGGMTREASPIVGAVLGATVAMFVFGMRSPNYGVSRTLVLSAAAAGIYLAVMLGAVMLAWLALRAAGLQQQSEHDRTVMTVVALGAVMLLMRAPARYAAVRFWTRYIL